MSILRTKSLARVLAVLPLLSIAGQVNGQSGSGAVSFGTVAIGKISSPSDATLTFTSAGTVAKELALTGGAEKQDFAIAAGGTCSTGQSYAVGSRCTVSATFLPLYAGPRMGSIVLEDASGNFLASTYVFGTGSGPQVSFHLGAGAGTGFPYLGITADKGLAIDGSGNLFMASVNSTTAKESVVEVPLGCEQATCVRQLAGMFFGIWGLAIDGAGNLWVGDVGANGTISEIPAAGGYSTVTTYKGSFGNQIGMAVDGSGNVYFTGSGTGSAYAVMELVAAGGYSTVRTLTSGYNSLEGIAVDGAGDVFFVDSWDRIVKEIVAVNGTIPTSPTINNLGSNLNAIQAVAVEGNGNLLVTSAASDAGGIFELLADNGYANSTTFSNGFTAPTGIVLNGGGDVFVVDTDALGGTLYEIARSAAPSIVFGTTTAPGEIDTADGPQKIVLENLGNQPLALAGLTFSSSNFSLDGGTTTCEATATLGAGNDCVLGIQFSPTVAGGEMTGAVSVKDNTLNAVASAQSIALKGTSLYAPVVNLAEASAVIAVSQPFKVSVTVSGGQGNPTPTGTVQASAPGYTSAAVALSNGVATVTIPAGTFSPGQSTVAVRYTPDTASATVYTTAIGQTSVTVTSKIENVPTVTVIPAIESIAMGQAVSVTVDVSPSNGAPMPTGSVTLAAGSFTSTATTLNSGTATITIPANSLTIGTDEIVATYTPDAASTTIYVSADGASFVAVGATATAAGAAPVDFGSFGIAKTSAAMPITLTFPANSTPASLIATTLGATGKDFAIVAGGSCGVGVNVAAGQSCTVDVTFTPGFAGLRNGAVLAEDPNGMTLAMTYVHGSGTGAQLSIQSDPYLYYDSVIATNYPYSFTTLSNGFSYPNVAVDGAGNVFVSDGGNGANAVKEIPAGCASASCNVTVATGVEGPTDVAIDGAGNLYVTESLFGDVKKIPVGCQSPSCMQTIGGGFNQPYGLSVDSSGNVFVADTFNNAVKEVLAAGGYTTINTLASGLDLPWDVVVNANGDLFVAEGGDQCTVFLPGECSTINTSLLEIPAAGGYKTIKTLSSGEFGKPFGLTIDGGGNVYEADYGDQCATEFTAGSGYAAGRRLCTEEFPLFPVGLTVDGPGNLYLNDMIKGNVYKMDYVDLPSMTFKTATLKGVADLQDGAQVVSVQNNGTSPLVISSMEFSHPSFKFDPTVSTCSTATPVPVGSSCYLAVDFAPVETGPINATLTLTDNNLNQSSATQGIQIAAVALPPVPVILTNPANPTTATSASFTFSDTQTPITFVCSIDSLPFSACSSPATFPGLSGGAHSFQVRAKDTAGNLSDPAVYNWTINSVGPPAPVITSPPAGFTNDDTATFTFTDAQAGVSYQCSLDGAAFAACTSGVSYSGLAPAKEYYISTLHHSFAVKAMDASNNFSLETTRSWITDNQGFSAYPVDFGLVPVGQTSGAESITFNIGTAATVAAIDATTLGVTGLDFAVSDASTCAVGTALSKGATCTLKATFAPKYPGQRKGAVLLLDAKGNGIGEAYLQGTGTAPQVTFGPYSTVFYNILAPQNNTDPGKNLLAPVSDVAIDGAGNLYAADMSIFSEDQSISVSTGDIWKFAPGCTGPTCSTLVATERNAKPTPISLILPSGLNIDGAGVLWVSNYYLWPQILDTVGQWYPSECSFVAAGLSPFQRTVADGAGNLALVGNGLVQNCYKNLGVGQKTQTTSFDFSTNTPSMTIDPAGNYFVADAGNNAVKEVLASSNYTISRTVGSGFSSPYGVASDAYGNIYVSDTGHNAIKEIVASSGYTQVLTIATFDPKAYAPGEIAVDALGNVFIAGTPVNSSAGNPGLTNQFEKLDFSDTPALKFATATMIGTIDTLDGTLTATVKNSGNAPLTISGLMVSNVNFRIDAGATTCSTSAPLAVGASCTVGVLFTPTTTGALTGTLNLIDNALNAAGTTQKLAFSGTAYSIPKTSTPTVKVAPTPASVTTAQSDVVTVTVSGASGNPTPTGAVSLVAGSYSSAVVSLSGGAAVFAIPGGALAVGAHTVNAIYTPDKASSAIYGAGAGSAKVTVTAVSKRMPTVAVSPAAIDISTRQALAVAVAVSGGHSNPTPSGSVTLSGGNFASLATTLSNGSANITIPSGYLPAGPVELTAYYTPDFTGQVNYTSASGTGQVSVEAAGKTTPTLTVTPTSASIYANQPLQVTLQVNGGLDRSTPTGAVVLTSGRFVSPAAVLSHGSVIVSIPAGMLAVGADKLSASYTPDKAGSLTFNSTSGSGSINVNSALVATTTTLQASASSIAEGASLTLTATVAQSSSPGKSNIGSLAVANLSSVPTGSVTYVDGTTVLGSATLNGSGAATFSTTALAIGSHSIAAIYGGDSDFAASTSPVVSVMVTPAPAPVASLTTVLAFPITTAGTTSAALSATLSNTGNATLNIGSVALGGANPGEFAFANRTNACGKTLAAGASCSIYVMFRPEAAQGYAATLTVTDNASPTTQSTALTGTGKSAGSTAPVGSLTPIVSFPSTTVGTTSAATMATLANTGNATLNIGGIALGGTNPTDFAIGTGANACAKTVAAGASCSIYLTFTPAAAEAYAATLTVTDDASPATQTASLTGTGVAAPAPVASLSPASLSFASTAVGATTSAQVATLKNTGNAALAIGGVTLTGANPTDFAQSNTCGSSLAAGSSCTISITFTPASAASFAATLSVGDNASGSPQTVSLSGTGTAPLTPSFTVSSSTAAQTVQPGGTATYTIAVSAQDGAFSNAVALAASGLPAGATATFSPASITPGSASGNSTLSIRTTAATAAAQTGRGSVWPLAAPVLAIASLLLLPGKRRRRWITMALLVLASLGALTMTACGGGFSLTPSAQTYTVTVSGASGALQQSTTVQLTVQ